MSKGEQAQTEARDLRQPGQPAQPETPLDALVNEVRSDARRDPEQYARESIVPKGGE